MDFHQLISQFKSKNISKVHFAVADIDGVLRSKLISLSKFESLNKQAVGFCDVIFGWDMQDKCYDNTKLTGLHEGYPDRKATIDINTLRFAPWNDNIPYFIADMSADEHIAPICPRTILRNVQSKAHAMGFSAIFAQEFEWFNFQATPTELEQLNYQNIEPLSPSMFGYSQLRPSLYSDYFNDLFDGLLGFNIPLEGLHTETGPGVYEAAIDKDSILNAADKACLLKTAVKEIAYRHKIVPSFMAKFKENLPGCSGHLHQSLWSIKGDVNLFAAKNNQQIPELMQHYMAGILHCLPHILPMYAPTINSYKRLNGGDWAPNTISWGIDNRTTAIRVLPSQSNAARLELRVPGSDVNPYLAMAASLASGLYGIENKLALEQTACKGSAYSDKTQALLPNNLLQATLDMQKSNLAQELFGSGFVEHFCQTRLWECKQYSTAVTDWELRRYFEII